MKLNKNTEPNNCNLKMQEFLNLFITVLKHYFNRIVRNKSETNNQDY